jgi:hypothetical protein
MNSADAILALMQTARGDRPYSLQAEETEQVLNITLALLVELAVSNDRIDRLERAVAELKGMSLEDYRDAPLGAEADAARKDATDALMIRALRVIIDPRQPSDGRQAAVSMAGLEGDKP